MSCGSAGNCAVGGEYTDISGHTQAFVADEVNGTWGDAIVVPGVAALNTGGFAQVISVSCPSAGNCSADGKYSVSPSIGGANPAFVVGEVNRTWGDAIQVPGTAALSVSDNAAVLSVSCPPAGSCAGAGDYADSSGLTQAFVLTQN